MFEIKGKCFIYVCGWLRPVIVSKALVRTGNTKCTFVGGSVSISQGKFFEDGGTGEDEVSDGMENFAVPYELNVKFGIAEG